MSSLNFKGFRATRPIARLINPNDPLKKRQYEVFFIVYSGKEKKVFRYKKGVNSVQPGQRKHEAQARAESLLDALLSGWDPRVNKYPMFKDDFDKMRQLTFTGAIDYCLLVKKKTLSKLSCYNYEYTARAMKKAAISAGYGDTLVTLIERRDIRMIISEAKDINAWGSKARNQNLAILKAILSVLVDEDRIRFNPAKGIKAEKQPERTPYKRLTPEEKEKIVEYLSVKSLEFLEFILFIYDTGIRPKELLMLKISDINLISRQIIVREEVAKTNKSRVIPITDDILKVLLRREVHSIEKGWTLFSNNKFLCGPNPFTHTAGNRWWRKLVMRDLKIDCKLYSLKHLGADDKLLAGVPIRALKNLFGHTSEQMTEKYLEVLQQKLNQQIIDTAPSFTAKVIDMKKAK